MMNHSNSNSDSMKVAGVDGCRAGWIVATVSLKNKAKGFDRLILDKFAIVKDFAEVIKRAKDSEIICVDIPVGLSDNEHQRLCDVQARRMLGRPRASSIFTPPSRYCLWAVNYEQASSINLKYTGRKLNKQSYNLIPKIHEVDDLMTPKLHKKVREIHPEIGFFVLNGQKAIVENKKSVRGRTKRLKLLDRIFGHIRSHLRKASNSGYSTDDALDAAVAAWTAAQAVRGRSFTLPERPETDGRGLRMEILCPRV